VNELTHAIGSPDLCPDELLLARIAARGSTWQAALGQLTRRHRSYLEQRCRRYLRQADEVEDVMQEIDLSVYRYAHQFRGDAGYRTWLTTIADRHCLAHLRKQPSFVLSGDLSELGDLQDTVQVNAQHDTAEDETSRHQVADMVERLPPIHRELLLLRYWLDLSLPEIADLLDIGLSAAKMRLKRALEQYGQLYFNDGLKAA
jgi:RNA polymerase sigma-70 factor (ECF subfamily)